jgi:hypothetical protein
MNIGSDKWASPLTLCKEENERLNDKLVDMTINMGRALESVRQLTQLATAHNLDAATCVRVARRFLAEMEGGK